MYSNEFLLVLGGRGEEKKTKQKVIFSVKRDNKIISVESKLCDRIPKDRHSPSSLACLKTGGCYDPHLDTSSDIKPEENRASHPDILIS